MVLGNRRIAVSVMRKAWPTRFVAHHMVNDVGVHIWLLSWRRTVVTLALSRRKVQP